MNRDDVRVVEARQRASLAGEALGNTVAGLGAEAHHLQRHQAVQRDLAGLVDHAHAPVPDQPQHLEVRYVGRLGQSVIRAQNRSGPGDLALGGHGEPKCTARGPDREVALCSTLGTL